MSHRPIIDAGPGLNFLSVHKERLLISVLGRLSAPEIVQTEVLRKSRQDQRFRDAENLWRKLSVSTMCETYTRLRGLDDGLPPIETTNLLSPTLWT